MSRNTGTFNFAANFEGLLKAPIDARQMVCTYADLTSPSSWSGSTGVWLYDGAIVVVASGVDKGIYWLCDAANYTSTSSWVKAGTGSGTGTLTGATNGLHLVSSGTTVVLGGNLTSGTTISGQGIHNLSLTNIDEFQAGRSGGTTVIGFDSTGILLSHDYSVVDLNNGNVCIAYQNNSICADSTGVILTTSGGSVSLTQNPSEGLIYGGAYTSSNPNWIPTKTYVDAIASGLVPKGAVTLATTTNLTNWNGSNFTGVTTIDGVTTTNGMRVLVKNQVSSGQTNGIWVANTGTWTRATDFDGTPSGETVSGNYMWVLSGNTNAQSSWVLITPNPIYIGTTPLTFVLFNHVQDVQSGNAGIVVSAVTGTHYVCLDTVAMAVRANAITGATNLGAGTSVCSSISAHNISLNTIKGSGGTTVQKIGQEIIVCSTTASGSQQYSGQTPSAVALCGISIGYQLTGKTVSCIIQVLLVPELFQTSVGTPSTSVGATFTGTLEIGCSVSQTITPTYTAGAVTPLYCTLTPFTRGGPANNYSYTGPSVSTGFLGCTSCVINPYVVTSGSQTWSVCTKYDAGACIRGSKNTVNPTYPTICPLNSCTPTGSVSITGILPWYWGTSASGTITGANVAAGTKTVAVVGSSTPIIYNATAQYLWFAGPSGTFTAKTKWWVCAANAGNIGGTGELWAAACTVAVTSLSGCWTGCNYSVYVTCGITTTAAGVSMCLYF